MIIKNILKGKIRFYYFFQKLSDILLPKANLAVKINN